MPTVTIEPLTPERWPDLETLFGPRGACAGCWEMWWRVPRSQFGRQQGEGNKAAFREIVLAGEIPGLLVYVDGVPAGWCAVQPREAFPGLARSRILKPVDDTPVWAVTCFFIARAHRRKGLTVRLLEAAIAHARARGARVVEGYPVAASSEGMPDAFAWHGTVAAFARAGFVEVARRSPTRPIMRYVLPA